MIFEGENSTQCKRKAISKNGRFLVYIYALLFIIAFPTALILMILDINSENMWILLVASLFCLFLSLSVAFLPLIPINSIIWKRKIEFTENKVIYIDYISELNITKNVWDISSIKKIIDEDIYYEIRIKKTKLCCEKSLLCQGTLDEFENRFNSIIRKKKNKLKQENINQ